MSSSFRLTVCPFSVAVFVGTALFVTLQQQKQRRRQQQQQQNTLKSSTTSSSTTLPRCQVVFVLGGPGSGKGTQCQLLVERLKDSDGQPQWAHLSAGDLLRAERSKQQGELAEIIQQCIATAQLVPSHVTCRLLENGMHDVYDKTGITNFLIDGFPRSFGNATAWEERMSCHDIAFVLNFECPQQVLLDRLLERGQTSGRVDDVDVDVIRKRFETNQRETAPIIEHYRQQEGKLKTVASDKPIEEVYQQVAALFGYL